MHAPEYPKSDCQAASRVLSLFPKSNRNLGGQYFEVIPSSLINILCTGSICSCILLEILYEMEKHYSVTFWGTLGKAFKSRKRL